MSINVPRLQFYNMDSVKTCADIKKSYAIPGGLPEIEFTESVMFDNWERLISIVDQLYSCGFVHPIDDFGKGYSSLGMFKNLNVDVLKIDALFSHNLEAEEKDWLLVGSVIQPVWQFDAKTVAEGIETRGQIGILEHMHCDHIQGYVYYKPMPQKEYEKLLLQLFPLCAQEAVMVCPAWRQEDRICRLGIVYKFCVR